MLLQRLGVQGSVGPVQRTLVHSTAGGLAAHRTRRRCRLVTRASRDSPQEEEEPAQVFGDWRAFRARLVQKEVVERAASPERAPSLGSSAPEVAQELLPRVSESNQRLLEIQNGSLAAEGTWCHATPGIEPGCVLLSTPQTPDILVNDSLEQVCVFLMQHTKDGSVGIMLNRPTSQMFGNKKGGLRFQIQGAPPTLQEVFTNNRVYMGGDVAQQVIHMVHPYEIPGCVPIVPGIYMGGEAAAADMVQAGRLAPDHFKFFSGAMVWEPGQLEREIRAGCWYTAACSRSLVLKQCIQLPTPLWREMLLLMGGPYVRVAEQEYEGDEVSGE